MNLLDPKNYDTNWYHDLSSLTALPEGLVLPRCSIALKQ